MEEEKKVISEQNSIKQKYVYTWGLGAEGQLGTGSSENQKIPYRVKIENPVEIAAGGQYSAIVTASGQLYMMGSNKRFKMGLINEDNFLLPTLIKLQAKIKHVSCGDWHTIICDEGGSCYGFYYFAEFNFIILVQDIIKMDVLGQEIIMILKNLQKFHLKHKLHKFFVEEIFLYLQLMNNNYFLQELQYCMETHQQKINYYQLKFNLYLNKKQSIVQLDFLVVLVQMIKDNYIHEDTEQTFNQAMEQKMIQNSQKQLIIFRKKIFLQHKLVALEVISIVIWDVLTKMVIVILGVLLIKANLAMAKPGLTNKSQKNKQFPKKLKYYKKIQQKLIQQEVFTQQLQQKKDNQ